jgi:type I restriction enzyme R subunit
MPVRADQLKETTDYQKLILDELVKKNGYILRKSDTCYNQAFAMDTELLFKFLYSTQADKMEKLKKIYKTNFESTVLNVINNDICAKNGSLIDSFKNGVEFDNGTTLDLYYPKPETTLNPITIENYNNNIFSVMEEVYHKDKERIDLVIFLNGIAIFAFELKCNTTNQDYKDAIIQYKNTRDATTRLFLYKKGVFAAFAMDLNEAWFTTKLNGKSSYFMPFNKGDNYGAGNPHNKNGINVSYIWEDILTKETISLLITHFIFVQYSEETDADTGNKIKKESLIFPRYHQLRAIRRICADVKENLSERNYLIEHSAGSGKTNTIAWLAHILSQVHDANNNGVFDTVLIITDRIVVDRQLQDAVLGVKHKLGTVKVMDDKCDSGDLEQALKGNTRIIVTTIHKFFYILGSKLLQNLGSKRFAVLIDEAHQSTEGSLMQAVTTVLAGDEDDDITVEDKIVEEINKTGKQSNVSMIAFTATPKGDTLQLFGTLNAEGKKEAFDIYSMKQAIEEGYILNVLNNYTTYKTFFELNKNIADDPELKSLAAKRKILQFIDEHPTNIAQKVRIIVEHFRENIAYRLDGKAKAMVVTSSIKAAIEYRQEFDRYIAENNYDDIKALVAFSGSKTIGGETFTEVSMNGGIPEEQLRLEFDKSCYQVLLVANKYQTGFDQKKLCAMYIDKKLRGVAAVQTLSRLNRIYPPYQKETFILDFKNDYEDIKSAFDKYYKDNVLREPIRPADIRSLYSAIEKYDILDDDDIEKFNEYLYKEKRNNNDKQAMWSLLDNALRKIMKRPEKNRAEIKSTIRKFLKGYSFLIQATCYENVELHKKYNYLSYLIKEIEIGSGNDFDVADKITVSDFRQEKSGEITVTTLDGNSEITIKKPVPTSIIEDTKKKLSVILEELNAQYGKDFTLDVASQALLQIRSQLINDETLRQSAVSNSFDDFKFSFDDHVDDALTEGYESNKDFFEFLLNNENEKNRLLHVFMREIYDSLRNKK